MRATCLVVLMLLSSGCAQDEPAPVCSGIALERPLIVLERALDLSASGIGRIDESGCLEEVADISLGTDPVLADAHGRPFVLNRENGEIHEMERDALRFARTVTAMAPGQPSPNPWDVDVDGDGRLWVARYDVASLGLVSAEGDWAGEVDLAQYADADGLPEAAAVAVAGDEAFVVLERLARPDGYAMTDVGRVAVFDAAPPHASKGAFDLLGRNPFTVSRMIGDDTALVVSSPGDHFFIDERDGVERDGVEVVDLVSRTSRLVLDEKEARGSVIAAVIAGPTEGYAIVSGPSDENPTSVVAFDPEQGVVVTVLASAPSFVHAGLAVVGNYLVVGDRTKAAARVLFFDRATHDLVGTLTPQLLPPLDLMAL
jgi:hypothetical protein